MEVKIGDVLYSAKEQPIMIVFVSESEKNLVAKMAKGKMQFVQFPQEQKYLADNMKPIRSWMEKKSIPASVFFGGLNKVLLPAKKAGGIFTKLENWLQNIQRTNWGFPWHIVLAMFGFLVVQSVLAIWVPSLSRSGVYAGVFMSLVGVVNEMVQKESDKAELYQDLLGNTIGILLGALVLVAGYLAGGI